MHETNVNTEVSKKQRGEEFTAFHWLKESVRTRDTDLLGLAKDVAAGVALSLQLMEKSDLKRCDGGELLTVTACGILERFAITACELLESEIDRHFDHLNDTAIKEGK